MTEKLYHLSSAEWTVRGHLSAFSPSPEQFPDADVLHSCLKVHANILVAFLTKADSLLFIFSLASKINGKPFPTTFIISMPQLQHPFYNGLKESQKEPYSLRYPTGLLSELIFLFVGLHMAWFNHFIVRTHDLKMQGYFNAERDSSFASIALNNMAGKHAILQKLAIRPT